MYIATGSLEAYGLNFLQVQREQIALSVRLFLTDIQQYVAGSLRPEHYMHSVATSYLGFRTHGKQYGLGFGDCQTSAD